MIGVCALGVSLYETSLMREEQRAAVLPLLELGRSYWTPGEETATNKWRLSLHAGNVGIGPARILDFHVTVDGVAKPTRGAAMQALLDRTEPVLYGQSTVNGRTIPPERAVEMFTLNHTDLAREIVMESDRLDFEACFCSVFDDCWTTSYSTLGAAIAVDSCQRNDNSFQE